MGKKLLVATYLVVIAVAMVWGLITAGSAVAQEGAATETIEDVTDLTQPVEADTDEGFDDWGLLGLLGLYWRPSRRDHDVDTAANPVERPAANHYDDSGTTERRNGDFI